MGVPRLHSFPLHRVLRILGDTQIQPKCALLHSIETRGSTTIRTTEVKTGHTIQGIDIIIADTERQN